MSEEEKKAIEYLENRLDILHNNTQWATENSIKVVLNLIDNQQKEIDCQGKRLLELAHLLTFDYISKDKIKHTLLKFQNEYGEDLETTGRLFIGKEVIQYGEDILDEIAAELDIKLLEEE